MSSLKEDKSFKYLIDKSGVSVIKCLDLLAEKIIVPPSFEGLPVVRVNSFFLEDCKNVKSVWISEGIKFLQASAFQSVQTVEEIHLPSTIEDIGNHCFTNCSNLQKLNLEHTKIKEISKFTFDGCFALQELSLPDSLQAIGECVFSHCSITKINLDVEKSQLVVIRDNAFYSSPIKSFPIPVSLKVIGSCAFKESNIEAINFPDKSNIQIIDSYCFQGCPNIKTINFPHNKFKIALGKSVFANASIAEPLNLKYAYIETLPEDAFNECNITSIVLPDCLHSIGNACFAKTKIKSIKIPVNVDSIGQLAFSNSQLEEVTWAPRPLKNRCRLGSYTFSVCKIKQISIPSYVVLGVKSFLSDSDLKKVVLDEPLYSQCIPFAAFYHCGLLEEINIPEGYMLISEDAFHKCSLNKVKLPQSLQEISKNAFSENLLKEIRLGENIQLVGEFAFSNNEIEKINFDYFFNGDILTGAFINNPIKFEDIESPVFASVTDGAFHL